MAKFDSPLKEIDYTIGMLYELSLQSNFRLTDAVNNLRITVGNLMAAETHIRDIDTAQKAIEMRYKMLSNI